LHYFTVTEMNKKSQIKDLTPVLVTG